MEFIRIFSYLGKIIYKYLLQIFRHYFFCIDTIKLIKLLSSFQIILFVTKMSSLNRNEKITCENCGVQITKYNLARHKKRCSAGTLYCTQSPNFLTSSQGELNYHIAKQHSAAGASNTYKCNLSRRISWLLCCTSTQKHSTWETNWVWSEQY